MARLDRLKRHGALLAAASYLLVGLAVLGPSIRPGHTLVPADIVTAVQPYNEMAGGVRDHNPIVSDTAFQFFPWVHAFGAALHHGHVPQWNPAVLGGLPTSPNGFVAPYYPPSWLAAWLNPYDFYDVFVLLHLVLGALGVYAFARVIGARPLSSWIVGLLGFAAAFWVHWSMHLGHIVGLVGAPWALAATHLVVTRPTSRRVAALAAVFGLWWLGANPQYAYYGTLAMSGYAATVVALRAVRHQGRLVLPAVAFGGAIALGAALAAPVLLSSATLTGTILRTREPPSATADTHLARADAIRLLVNEARGNPPDHVKESTDPEALMDAPFVGVTAIVLAGAALFARRRRALVMAAATAAVLVLGFTGPLHHLLYHLPGYDRFRVSARWLGLLPVFLLPLAAFGVDALRAGERRSRFALVATASACAALTGLWYIHQRHVAGAPHLYLSHRAAFTMAIVAGVVAGGLLLSRWPSAAVPIVVGCVLAEVLFHSPRWYPQITEKTAYPRVAAASLAQQRGGRMVHVGTAKPSPLMPLAPDIPMVYGVSDVQGWTVLFPKRYDRYLRAIHDHGNFAAASNAAPALPPQTIASPLLDALDVRTVVSDTELPSGGLPLLASSAGVFVYARPSPGPAVLVPTAERANERSMWRHVADPSWDPRQTAAVVGLRGGVHGTSGTVTRRSSSTDGDTWVVDAPGGGFLRVSGNDDAGWRASVDGRSVPVLLADGIFRGAVVAPGRHVVRFSYANADVRRGAWGAAIALVLVGTALAFGDRLVRWVRGRR